ncbi:hypothetical protein GGR00_005511 [Aminobacter aganoensis]|uniref:Uncharacterized protein n=1 Tax=Aminobacter aganoensis TaxID=83264 RepID=A0A7X0KNZ4_9HYPH|nr:hypothetical protein [Aminobacter aganoensis]
MAVYAARHDEQAGCIDLFGCASQLLSNGHYATSADADFRPYGVSRGYNRSTPDDQVKFVHNCSF